jgi:hypothetical protein
LVEIGFGFGPGEPLDRVISESAAMRSPTAGGAPPAIRVGVIGVAVDGSIHPRRPAVRTLSTKAGRQAVFALHSREIGTGRVSLSG